MLKRNFSIEFSVVTDTVTNLVEMERPGTAEILMSKVLDSIKVHIASAPALSLGERVVSSSLKKCVFIINRFKTTVSVCRATDGDCPKSCCS